MRKILLNFLWIIQSSLILKTSSSQELSVTKLLISSRITLRYAQTEVECIIENQNGDPDDVTFSMSLPNSAFISFFSMTVDGKEMNATVMEKKIALDTYRTAMSKGQGAGLVSQDKKNSNLFSISTNVEGGKKAIFKLHYEELLGRINGRYEQAININPGGIVEDMKVEVYIDESLPLSILEVPDLKPLKNDFFIGETEILLVPQGQEEINKDAVINWKKGSSNAHIVYAPDTDTQQKLDSHGVQGQFVVRYDVDRRNADNEVQVLDGHFVHFYSPNNLQRLPKHVVFVLDTSGSMYGEKIKQLKDAMFTILDDMTENDYYTIILFNSRITEWSDCQPQRNEQLKNKKICQATEDNKRDAINRINEVSAGGATDINKAMLTGLQTANHAIDQNLLPAHTQSLILFLTDGQPTVGERTSAKIRENVKNKNERKVPIFCIAFGGDADFNLMKGVSNDNDALAYRVYEGSDAALQLEFYFNQVASPLIANMTFKYVGEIVNSSTVSQAKINTFFEGGEHVVVGRLNEKTDIQDKRIHVILEGEEMKGHYQEDFYVCPAETTLSSDISAQINNLITCRKQPKNPAMSRAQNFMKKLYAFVNIKQLLMMNDKNALTATGEKAHDKALRLSLENNFVTELTSLVVVDEGNNIRVLETGGKLGSGLDNHNLNGKRIQHNIPTTQLNTTTRYLRPRITSPRYPRLTTTRYQPTTTQATVLDSLPMNGFIPSTSRSCSGSMTLFSKTYYRGKQLNITKNIPDLADNQFSDQLVSVKVEGSCCWKVFSLPSYEGISKTFCNNEIYQSTTSVGKMFRNAKSVLKYCGRHPCQQRGRICPQDYVWSSYRESCVRRYRG